MDQSVSVLIGTTKGAFILDGDDKRGDWVVRGPLFDGWPINHVIGDPETGRIWAAGGPDPAGFRIADDMVDRPAVEQRSAHHPVSALVVTVENEGTLRRADEYRNGLIHGRQSFPIRFASKSQKIMPVICHCPCRSADVNAILVGRCLEACARLDG